LGRGQHAKESDFAVDVVVVVVVVVVVCQSPALAGGL